MLEKRAAGAPIDLSLLTDGLEAEREQGITIDVAYRYFATQTRKFIIADAPGHEQYTRNMVTAAAGSDAAVVLVDITKIDLQAPTIALLPQTRRHALLAHLLRVPSIVFAVNKLDAVDDPRHAFERSREALLAFAAQAGIAVAGVIPVSALRGDNVTQSPATTSGELHAWADWYQGPSLLQLLEASAGGAGAPGRRAAGAGPVRGARGRRHRQPAAHACGAASRMARCVPATRSRSSRAASRRWWPRCGWPAPWWTVRRRGNRPGSCSIASSMSRAATGSPRPRR